MYVLVVNAGSSSLKYQLFDTLYGAGIIKEITSDIENFYELVDEEMYTDDKGLNLSVESGMDLYL